MTLSCPLAAERSLKHHFLFLGDGKSANTEFPCRRHLSGWGLGEGGRQEGVHPAAWPWGEELGTLLLLEETEVTPLRCLLHFPSAQRKAQG